MISVIVPVYNVREFLCRCVESILSQSFDDIEVILVDDGSNDGSGEICDEFAERDKRVKIIHKENGGLSSARNAAMEIATGEYLFFVDSDDYILPGILKELVVASKNYNADVSCCGYVTGKEKFYCEGVLEELDTKSAVKKMFSCDGIDANACCKLYKKELFDDIKYPLCVYEVVPVTYRVLLRANKVVNTHKPGYYIEKREGSITRSEFGFNNLLYVDMSYEEYLKICKDYPDLSEYAYSFFLNALISMREKAEHNHDENIYSEKIKRLFTQYYDEIKKDRFLTKRKKLIALTIKLHVYKVVYYCHRFIR